jgi:hypothetical protein
MAFQAATNLRRNANRLFLPARRSDRRWAVYTSGVTASFELDRPAGSENGLLPRAIGAPAAPQAGPAQAQLAVGAASRSAAAARLEAIAPAVQVVAAAAGGFMVAAALAGVFKRRRRPTVPRSRRLPGRAARLTGRAGGRTSELVRIVGTRSVLVDVHLLGER